MATEINGSDPSILDSSSQPKSQIDAADSSNSEDLEYGFQRPEIKNRSPLLATIDAYDRHVFLCYQNHESWPARVEGPDADILPRLLAAALKSRKNEIPRNTRLTICEGQDGSESTNGDILIFPDMIRYRGLTHSDVDGFVENVLVEGGEWVGKNEPLSGSHVFVCCHGSRDRRCGVCGPALVKKFQEEIELRGLKDEVFVSPCSHIGGHKYAGNLIIFSSSVQGKVNGHWYGYVTPDDVSVLLDQHIGKGEIVDPLWRGQMGLTVEEQKQSHERRLQQDEVKDEGGVKNDGASCCQGANGFSCCRDESKVEDNKGVAENGSVDSGCCKSESKLSYSLTSWFKTWDQSDTYATLAVIGAVASVAVAYSVYRRST